MNNTAQTILIITGVLAGIVAINFAPMISPMTPGMEPQRYAGITVHALPEDAADAQHVAERIARDSRAVVEALAADTSEEDESAGVANGSTADSGDDEVEVILYHNQWALHRKTIGLAGAILPSWFIGDNTERYVLIVSPSRPGPTHSRESVEQAAVHEYVHVMTDRRNKALGYWMKEGIALYLAGQEPTEGALAQHADLTWTEFSTPNAMQFAQVGGYSLAWDMIDYIVQEHSWQSVIDLIDPDASFETVLGYDQRALYDRWIEDLRDRV